MIQMYLERIIATTSNLESCYEILRSILDDLIKKITAQVDGVKFSSSSGCSSFCPFDDHMPVLEDLLQLQLHLRETQERSDSSVSALSSLLPEKHGHPHSKSSNTLYVTPNPLIEVAAICKNASSDLARSRNMISGSIATLQDGCCYFDKFYELNEAIARYLNNIQKLHELHEETAVTCQKVSIEQTLFHAGFPESFLANCDSRGNSSATPATQATVSTVCSVEIPDTSAAVTQNQGADTTVPCKNPELDRVHFSAIVPGTFVKGEYTLLDIIMYEDSFRTIVDEMIADAERPVKETKSGTIRVDQYACVKVVLSSPDLAIDDNIEEQYWQGEYARFSFAIELPLQYQKPQILFIATIYIDNVIATRLKFIAKCQTLREQKLEVSREDVLSPMKVKTEVGWPRSFRE